MALDTSVQYLMLFQLVHSMPSMFSYPTPVILSLTSLQTLPNSFLSSNMHLVQWTVLTSTAAPHLCSALLQETARVGLHRTVWLVYPFQCGSCMSSVDGRAQQLMQQCMLMRGKWIFIFLRAKCIWPMLGLASVMLFLSHTVVFAIILQNGGEQASGA